MNLHKELDYFPSWYEEIKTLLFCFFCWCFFVLSFVLCGLLICFLSLHAISEKKKFQFFSRNYENDFWMTRREADCFIGINMLSVLKKKLIQNLISKLNFFFFNYTYEMRRVFVFLVLWTVVNFFIWDGLIWKKCY